jgi:tRNA 5-methylaminomethyl-2-thiouridine biosynthesis bifunctional protein
MRIPQTAELTWDADGTPISAEFGDVYYSRGGGLAECEAVFLAGCGLPAAWAGRQRYAIAELGFGTGLNALATWRMWRANRPPGASLHFVSTEAHPIDAAAAARAHQHFPEIADLSARLLARWPVQAFGPQTLWFPEDGFCLTLWIGDAAASLQGMTGLFDAWLLDGFAPARNPQMWRPELFAAIAALSAPGATAATYSVAGSVRQGLADVGFTVTRRPGFGAKRQRLEARLDTVAPAPPKFQPRQSAAGKTITIIGAGIAGACIAAALARRNIQAIVLDGASGPAKGASGNPCALIAPRLDRGANAAARFYLAAYLFALDAYRQADLLSPIGIEERAKHDDQAALADLLADPPLPAPYFRAAGAGAALHALSGTVAPVAVVEAFLAAAELRANTPVAAIERDGEGWLLRDPSGAFVQKSGAVVIAGGPNLAAFTQLDWLRLGISRGQVDWIGLSGPAPLHAVSGDGYAAPWAGGLMFGATFDAVNAPDDHGPTAQDSARNHARLLKLAPELAARLDGATGRAGARVSFRAAAPDRLPLMGAAPDRAAFATSHSARFAKGQKPSGAALALPGLYLLGGLGARGFLTAPLLGEALACEILGEPSPLDWGMLEAIHPLRQLIRAAKSGAA